MPNEIIKPALTAEEWNDFRAPVIQGEQAGAFIGTHAVNLTGPLVRTVSVAMHDGFRIGHFHGDSAVQLMALANASLSDDDPRKITLADLLALRQSALFLEEQRDGMLSTKWPDDANPWRMLAPTVRELAAKLAALLPPEDTAIDQKAPRKHA
jgi:hypothetical protein